MPSFLTSLLITVQMGIAFGAPTPSPSHKVYDVQGHRGGRGDEIENTLPAFARGLINGVTTLEMDNGITKDGVVVTWHDEQILDTLCKDTKPAFNNDPDFPYVGKFIANLTLAQVKTLDCGSLRQIDFPMQLIVPGTKISTQQEVFEFVKCADPQRRVRFNIESKSNPSIPGISREPEDFVRLQLAVFLASGYPLESITYQSFDWRTLIGMKKVEPRLALSALIDADIVVGPNNTLSVWQAGLNISAFPGNTQGEQIVNAAASIGATILSPEDTGDSPVVDPTQPGYVAFTTPEMVNRAHEIGMQVKPWTVDRLNIVEQLLDMGVDGIITDFAGPVRDVVAQRGFALADKFPEDRVMSCLKQHLQIAH